MSYGEGVPPLELAGVRLACLSGDNGNGKTALLDAITWALFGKTRAPSEDDIVRLGASQATVLLDFVVEGNKYRVQKSRDKRKSGASGSLWELQIYQEDGSRRPISGTSARETQEKIRKLLRMDYDTFLKTGYLAQNSADEFARVKESERRKVLANILDLSQYERLEDMAKEKYKEAGDKEQQADRDIRGLDADIEQEDSYAVALEGARQRLAQISEEIAELRAQQEELAGQIEKLAEQDDKAREWELRSREVQEDIVSDGRLLTETLARIAEAEIWTARRDDILDACMRYAALSEKIKPLEIERDRALSLQEEARKLEAVIRSEQTKVENERYQAQCELETLENEAKDLAYISKEAERIALEIAQLGDPEARRVEAEINREAANEALIALKGEHGAIRAREAALQKRLDALTASESTDCEYCGQPLPPARRDQAIQTALAEQAELAREGKTVSEKGRDAKRDADKWASETQEALKTARTLSNLEMRRAHAEQEKLRFEERQKTLPDVRRRFEQLDRRVKEKEYAHPEQERLLAVTAQLERFERVAQELNATRTEVARYAHAERDRFELERADQVLQTEPEQADSLQKRITKRENQVSTARTKIAEFRARTAALPQMMREHGDLAARIKDSENLAGRAEREIGDLTGRLARIADLKDVRARRVEERILAIAARDNYKELVGAFGKKGLQALIVEKALPEIEEQANNLLGKMTDNAMRLQLVTQKDAKTKGAASLEVLNIIISDEMGTRPYEMFSGGEAFRINLSLRVALSKMLARRAGAPLQTLFLDEGFGTQDPRGREAIIESLQSIADEFALILVITHIEELKESFQTRIEVVKGTDGSTFSVA